MIFFRLLYRIIIIKNWDVRGRVVRVVDLESVAPHCCGFESRQGLWILSREEAIQLAYGTLLVLLGCPLVPEIMHGGASISKAGKSPYNLYSVGAM